MTQSGISTITATGIPTDISTEQLDDILTSISDKFDESVPDRPKYLIKVMILLYI